MNKEEISKEFDKYCENNKECNRICPSDRQIYCFTEFLIKNYNITRKENDIINENSNR